MPFQIRLVLILFALTLIVSCERDKFCDFELSDADKEKYLDLGITFLSEPTKELSLKLSELEKHPTYKEQLKSISVKPLEISKYEDVLSITFKKNTTWYMETDHLHLTISKDTTKTSLYWGIEDTSILLNCQYRINKYMRMRSITIHN